MRKDKHLELAKEFNSFAFELVNNEINVKKCIESLSNDTLYRRVIFQKYYYALYHKYLAHESSLNTKSGTNMHETILTKIKACNDDALYQTFSKLRDLRIWADYKFNDDNPTAMMINLTHINASVYNIIKRQTINC
ncbi:MAG: hypothetical protein WC390_03490 [Sulfurimonas sp.]|jgi:hypothetical protein